jgi:hypothetical protein
LGIVAFLFFGHTTYGCDAQTPRHFEYDGQNADPVECNIATAALTTDTVAHVDLFSVQPPKTRQNVVKPFRA